MKLLYVYAQTGQVMVDSGSLFVLISETTIHGTIPIFHNVLAIFGFPSYFSGRDNAVYHSGRYKPQSRTIMWSRESLPSTVSLFGGQSGRLKAIQASQATIGSNVGRHYLDLRSESIQAFQKPLDSLTSAFKFGILDPRGLLNVNFVLNVKFWVTQIICLDSLVSNIEPDRFHWAQNPRSEIHLSLKERVSCLRRQVCNLLGHLILWNPME